MAPRPIITTSQTETGKSQSMPRLRHVSNSLPLLRCRHLGPIDADPTLDGRTNPVRALNSVDLPAPFMPTSPQMQPQKGQGRVIQRDGAVVVDADLLCCDPDRHGAGSAGEPRPARMSFTLWRCRSRRVGAGPLSSDKESTKNCHQTDFPRLDFALRLIAHCGFAEHRGHLIQPDAIDQPGHPAWGDLAFRIDRPQIGLLQTVIACEVAQSTFATDQALAFRQAALTQLRIKVAAGPCRPRRCSDRPLPLGVQRRKASTSRST